MDGDRLSVQFEVSRPRLRALAYRMLGSHEEADDARRRGCASVGPARTTSRTSAVG